MNRVFRVVFNKVRGTLLVVNELTSSVSSKGRAVTTVALSAALLAVAGGVSAETYKISSTVFENRAAGWGSALTLTDAANTYDLSGIQFINNKAQDTDATGGAIYTYAHLIQNGGSFVGNRAEAKDIEALGGALLIKGATAVFTDVVFAGNSAKSAGAKPNSVAYGGAVFADYSTGSVTDVSRESMLTFHITKDMIYSGNTVSSDMTETSPYYDGYGYHSTDLTAGGFLFLDRGASATFDIDENATLTIGTVDTTGDTDGIASSIPNIGTGTNGGIPASLKKEGLGTLVINSSLEKFYGTVTVSAGELSVTKPWTLHGAVTVAGGTLRAENFTFGEADEASNVQAGSLSMTGGSLITQSGNLFVTQEEDVNLSSQAAVSGGTLVLTDTEYSQELSQQVRALPEGVNVEFTGTMLSADGNPVTETAASDLITTSGAEVVHAQVTAKTDANLTLTQGQNLGVKAIELTSNANEVTVESGSTLTLAGSSEGGALVKSATSNATLKVTGGTLNVGGADAGTRTKGELSSLVLESDGTSEPVAKLGNFDGTVTELAIGRTGTGTGTATMLIGNTDAQATMEVGTLTSGAGSVIFLDPAWDSNQIADVSDASGLAVQNVNGPIAGSVIAGQNSFAAFGTDLDGARSMINQLTPWGQSAIGAAVVVNAPIAIGSTGIVAADAANTMGATTGYTTGGLTVAPDSILVVNQSAVPAGGVLIDGDLTFNGNAQLGVVNATEGEFTIANSGDLAASQILTDNDMIESVLAGGKLTNKVNTDKVLGGVSSFGMQALTRRADMMFASSIADRTSFDQQPLQGLNLWVDVAGERYEADSLDNGGSFSADMGYAVFGADVAVNDQIRAGAAIQYADGTLRTDTMDAKNDFSSYGLSVYGSWQPVEWGKLVADVAYVKGKNGLSAATPALDSDVDTSMVSFGVRAQYQTTFGKFSFVPSVGLRVSRLETDSFNIGTIAVEDQSQTLVQMPIALRVNAAPMEAAGWTFGPSFKLAYVPTFGDKEVTVRGADATVIDTAPVQGAFGLRAVKGGVMLDANLLLGGGKGGTSSVGARIGARYTF